MQQPYFFVFVFLVILVHQDVTPLFLVILVFWVVGGWNGVLEQGVETQYIRMNRTKDYLTNLPGHLAQPSVLATRPSQPGPATRPG